MAADNRGWSFTGAAAQNKNLQTVVSLCIQEDEEEERKVTSRSTFTLCMLLASFFLSFLTLHQQTKMVFRFFLCVW